MNLPLSSSGSTDQPEAGGITVWKPVPGYPEFMVTADGQVKENGGPARVRIAGSGHVYVLRSNSRPALLVHRAVLMAWDRLPRDGEVCRHLDDNPANNRFSTDPAKNNLSWGTKKQNAADRIANAPAKNPAWTEERRLLERIKGLEEENLKLKTMNMRFKATIMNFIADRSHRVTESLLKDLGL